MDKLPEYLRDTVDWFMGKARKRDRECMGSDNERKLYLQDPLLELRIPETEINFLLDLPGGLDYNEWLASHTIGFFEHINLIYGTISEFCTPSCCPDMVGPGPRQYQWVDEKGKKSRLSAPQYIDYIMTYVQKSINDESTFPTKHGNEFPSGFIEKVSKIHRLLFHVLAHIYHSHFKEIVLLQLHAHLNAVFVHYVEFNLRFNIVDDKELEVLHDLIVALKIVTPNSETAPSLEENKENIRQMASADAVDNGNSDSKTTSTTEVPMEVEGSGETNTNESQQQQPNTSSNSATGSGGQTGSQCPEVEMVSDVDCSISEND
jgi:hypothetical protein